MKNRKEEINMTEDMIVHKNIFEINITNENINVDIIKGELLFHYLYQTK